jgi:hypothetical protein
LIRRQSCQYRRRKSRDCCLDHFLKADDHDPDAP